MAAEGSGATLDSIFDLGKEYIRTRFARQPDDPVRPGAEAVAVPAAAVAQSSNGMSLKDANPLLLVGLALATVLVLGIVLKKAG